MKVQNCKLDNTKYVTHAIHPNQMNQFIYKWQNTQTAVYCGPFSHDVSQ